MRRIQCLKYLVLANMLMESNVDPFDAQVGHLCDGREDSFTDRTEPTLWHLGGASLWPRCMQLPRLASQLEGSSAVPHAGGQHASSNGQAATPNCRSGWQVPGGPGAGVGSRPTLQGCLQVDEECRPVDGSGSAVHMAAVPARGGGTCGQATGAWRMTPPMRAAWVPFYRSHLCPLHTSTGVHVKGPLPQELTKPCAAKPSDMPQSFSAGLWALQEEGELT